MNIVKNLICLENDRASVIRNIMGKLEFIRKDGEIEFPITIDFWDWWKKVVSYVDDDPVDICLLYDKNYDLIKEESIIDKNIINTKESSWKFEHIKSYFWELKPTYFNLVIVDPELLEYPLNGNIDASARRFQTNLSLRDVIAPEIKSAKGTGENKQKLIENDDYTEFAKYFIDLIRRERGR